MNVKIALYPRLARTHYIGVLASLAAPLVACEPAATTEPSVDGRLSGPDDADEHYPPGCSELGPAACTTPCQRDDDAAACLHLAEGHLTGHGVPRDLSRAVELMNRSCALGLGRGCGYLAMAIGEHDRKAARDNAARGCDLGYGGACVWLVGHHIVDGTPPDWKAAAPYLQHGCAAQHGKACLVWGDVLRTGSGVTADVAAAKAAYKTACDAGEDEGCTLAASDPSGPVAHVLVDDDPQPDALRRANVRGHFVVEVAFCVLQDGAVRVDGITGATGALEQVVRDTARRWRFAPTGGPEPLCSKSTLDLQLG